MTSLTNLIADSKVAELAIAGGTLTVTYRPTKVTMAGEALGRKLAEAGDTLALARNVARVISDWDLEGPLTAEDGEIETDAAGDVTGHRIVERQIVAPGEKVPLTPEVLQHIPLPVLAGVLQAITEDAMPDPQRRRR